MKVLSTFLAVAVGFVCFTYGESIQRAEWKKLGDLSPSKMDRAIALLTPEHKLELIGEVKGAGMPESLARQYDDLLLHLGDEETIYRLADAMIHGDARESSDAVAMLKTCNDPKVIGAMCPFFLSADESDIACIRTNIVLGMITDTPGFSPSVYAWANELALALPYFSLRIMREWWIANAVNFEKRDYLAVKPGGLPPKDDYEPYKSPDGTWHMRLFGKSASWTPSVLNVPLPDRSVQTSAPRPPVEGKPLPESMHNFDILLPYCVVIAVLGVLVILWRRNSKH